MARTLHRLLKGFFLAIMFGVFGGGIIFGFVVTPFYLLLEKIYGHDPLRIHPVIRGFARLWLRAMDAAGLLRVRPSRGTPVDGPCVIVANHPGLFDVIVLIRDIPRLSVLAKQTMRTLLGLGPLFRLSGYVTAESRSSAFVALETTERSLQLIGKGMKFQLFPEGTRSPKGGLLPFKSGAFKLARRAGVPIQPVLIRHTPPLLPHEDKWYLPPGDTSLWEMEFLEALPPPEEGRERAAAAALEKKYRELLKIE